MNRKKKKAISKSQIIYDICSTPEMGMGYDNIANVFKVFKEHGVLLYESKDENGNSTNHRPQIIPHSKRVRIVDISLIDSHE